ncbi:hypothetical protein A2U01_0053065, partial [Trifolium medium]|nr:hypothetical protein [Trifolium medium]
KRKEEKTRESKPPPSKFTGYTPLNAPRERILADVSSADFKIAGIWFLKQLPAKDTIEILIQKGYARKYVNDGDKETHEAQMAIEAPTPEEEDNRAPIPTAFTISRAEDFIPPPAADEEGIMKHLTA